jgi:hypothetical protein
LYFPPRRKSKKKRRRTEVTKVTGRWTIHGLYLTGRVRSVFSVYACFSLLIGRAARPVTVDRTRPVVQGAYWTPTGHWHCGVRSVLQRIRSLLRCVLLMLDQRVRSARRAHPVSASRLSRCAIGVSDQLDQRVRSARLWLFQVSNGYIRRGMSINTHWPAQGSLS